jgi:glutamine amidotransferase
MRITLLDFGIGNLHSLAKALARRGDEVTIATEAQQALEGDALVLPGVGAFGAAVARAGERLPELRHALQQGHPCLGICLGMQLLYEASEEAHGDGIGLLEGTVRRLRARRVPQMGWNAVVEADDPLFHGLRDPVMYYANSYVVPPPGNGRVIAWTVYENERFPAAVRRGNTVATQFHPEKSGAAGLVLLDNFLQLVRVTA